MLLKCHLLVRKNFTVLITDRYFAFMYRVEKGERKSVSEKEETRMRLTDGQTMLSVCLWLSVVDGTDCVCVLEGKETEERLYCQMVVVMVVVSTAQRKSLSLSACLVIRDW